MARKKKDTDTPAVDAASTTTTVDDLPPYHGRKPVGMKSSVSGASNRITRSHGIGDRVVLVAEAECVFAGHKKLDGKLNYIENFAVVDLFEVRDAKASSRLLVALRQHARTVADAGVRTAIEGDDGTDMGAVGWTDASGVVLTPAEVAEIQGNPVAAFGSSGEKFVIVYDDGARSIWPDEFEPDTIRPAVGEAASPGSIVNVADILDGITGESIYGLGEGPGGEDGGTVTPSDDAGDVPALVLPTALDFEFVSARTIDALRDDLEDVTDAEELRRILAAEQQGRGTGASPRGGALKAIQARLDYVTEGVKLKLVKD